MNERALGSILITFACINIISLYTWVLAKFVIGADFPILRYGSITGIPFPLSLPLWSSNMCVSIV